MDSKTGNQQLLVLSAANRIARLLSKTQRIEATIEKLMREFLELVDADEGSIQLLRPSSGTTQRTLIRKGKSGESVLQTYIDDLMTGSAVKNKQPLLTNDIAATFKLGMAGDKFARVKSALAAPFLVHEEAIGAVNLIRTVQSSLFTEADLHVISSLANEVSEFVEQAQLREQLFDENERLRQELAARFDRGGIIGNSSAMNEVFSLLDRVIPTNGRVMVQGESGTGKELIAKYVHANGPRKDGPFVAVDCGALPANLLESELFGYVRGAFTGANQDRQGLFEEASGGTLFLDEIANMTLETQAKLLRVLQEEEVRPLGSNRARKVDVRVIVAASQDLKEKTTTGEFRTDLFYRLNVVPIRIPALRERPEDIPVLAAHFLNRFSTNYGRQLHSISVPTLAVLEAYPWPGNVRELENAMERAVILAADKDTQLQPEHLPYELSFPGDQKKSTDLPTTGNLDTLLADYERQILLNALRHHDWNQSAAAEALNISERVMRYKIKRLKLRPPK
ncbi:sigma-54-dependent Fis family transcriptional regulator [bacterium]|nr:sigma-54-dependent Fis family transcriptional regulator [bacterium]